MILLANGFLYTGQLNLTQNVTHETMNFYGCGLGAILTMAASMFPVNSTMYQHYLELAINITETCHHVADQTATKLLPAEFSFTHKIKVTRQKVYLRYCFAGKHFD